MKNVKFFVINLLATICEISLLVQQFFLDGNKLNIVGALWYVLTLAVSFLYVTYSFAVFFLQNKGSYLKLTKRDTILVIISYILISITIVLSTVSLLLTERLTLIFLLGSIVVIETILRLLLSFSVVKLTLNKIENVDYSQYAKTEVECNQKDESNIAFSVGIAVLLAFTMLLPCISIGFEDLFSLTISYHICLLISILVEVLCIKKMLNATGKYPKEQNKIKHLIVCLVFNQLIMYMFIWILFFGNSDYFRAFIVAVAIVSLIQIILLAAVPLSKLDIQMKLYIHNHFN